MAHLFRSSQVWAVEYQYDGRTRHWLKALPLEADAELAMRDLLKDWYGDRARLVHVRPATELEDEDYRRGRTPRNAYCPTGTVPTGKVKPPD
jgi:hypothetical protein